MSVFFCRLSLLPTLMTDFTMTPIACCMENKGAREGFQRRHALVPRELPAADHDDADRPGVRRRADPRAPRYTATSSACNASGVMLTPASRSRKSAQRSPIRNEGALVLEDTMVGMIEA